MTTDNRTNEPNQNETKSGPTFCFTEAQVEAAAKAIWERYAGHGLWATLPEARKSPFLKDARAALVAAQGAAPQAESEACGNTIAPNGDGRRWGACAKPLGHEPTCAPVLPSSTVGEGDLAKVIHRAACGPECTDDAPMRMDYRIARAVVEAIGGEGR